MAKIKKIVLEVGDQVIELSPEEAKELKGALGEIFQDSTHKHVIYRTVLPERGWPQGPYKWTSSSGDVSLLSN